jgi:PPOX class probable F420-dependent enzyme
MGDKTFIDTLLAEPLMCRFAVTRKDGGPLIRPIWFLWEDGKILISTKPDAIHTRIVRRNPKISVCVDKTVPANAAVICEGDVELVEGLGTDHDLIGRCAKKYLPPEAVDGFLASPVGQMERVRFVVTPRRWTIWDFSRTPPRGPSPGVYE